MISLQPWKHISTHQQYLNSRANCRSLTQVILVLKPLQSARCRRLDGDLTAIIIRKISGQELAAENCALNCPTLTLYPLPRAHIKQDTESVPCLGVTGIRRPELLFGLRFYLFNGKMYSRCNLISKTRKRGKFCRGK